MPELAPRVTRSIFISHWKQETRTLRYVVANKLDSMEEEDCIGKELARSWITEGDVKETLERCVLD